MQLAQILNNSVPTSGVINPSVLPGTTSGLNAATVGDTPLSFLERIGDSFQTAFDSFVAFLPEILAALIVLIAGWIIAVLLGKLVRKLLSFTRVDAALDKVGMKKIRRESGLELSAARFVGELVKWFLIIVFVLAASDILGLQEISGFLRSILLYFPNVVVAVVIVIIGVLVANFVHRLIRGAGKTAKLPSIPMIALFARWAIVIFSVLAALVQLQVAANLIQILFTGIIAMLALAGGLAFGLGGKDYATHLWKKFQSQTEDKDGSDQSMMGE